MADELENIEESQDEQAYLNQQFKDVYRKLKPLGFSWETIASLIGKKSGSGYRNIYNDLQNATPDQVKDLKLVLKFVEQICQFFQGRDVTFDFQVKEDAAFYAPIKKQLDIIEKKLDHTQTIADLLIENQANGNQSLKQAIEEAVIGTRGPRLARLEKAEKAKKKKESSAKPSDKKKQDDTPPPSTGGNNEPA